MSLTSKSIPDFSVIIPTYNRCNFLKTSIKSVLRQKNVSFEIIVSDNCSTDSTPTVVKEFKDKRIKYYRNKKNIGFSVNVRKCFDYSTGRYIFTLSDDDFILDDNTLFEILKVMKKYKVGLGNIGAIYWDKSPKHPCKIYTISDKLIILNPKKDKKTLLKALKINYVFYSGLVFDSAVVDKSKLNESYLYSFTPLVLNTIQKNGLAYIPNCFIVARISLRFVHVYYNLNRMKSFFLEDYFFYIKDYLHGKDFEKHKEQYIYDSLINIPSIKLFSNNKNYIRMLLRMIAVDRRFLIYPKFYLMVLIGFLPRVVLKKTRDFMIYIYEKKTTKFVDRNYNYFQRLRI